MAIHNIKMKKKNKTDWDILYPLTLASNVTANNGKTVQYELDTMFDKTATTTKNGAMSSTDKSKLDGIEANANRYVHPNNASTRHVTDAQISQWNDKYTKLEIDNKFNELSTGLDWKESVDTFNNIATKYPNPQDGWTVNTKDTDITYRYTGTEWIAISANAIPLASQSVDGKMSKTDKKNLDNLSIKVSDLEGQIGSLNNNVNGDLTKLTSRVDTTEKNITTINGKISSLESGKANTNHNHDNTYLKLTGGTVSGTINATNLQVGGANVYTTSRKPTSADIGATPGATISGTTADTAQWYRIAQTTSGDQANTIGKFTIRASAVSGKHSSTIITAGITYGQNPVINQLAHTQYSVTGISKARIVYHTTYTGNRAYLEVYVPDATARTIDVQLEGSLGWTLVAPSTVGSIPSGYTNKEITLSTDRIVANLAGSITGNAATATKLQTAKTINGVAFDGTNNITITDSSKVAPTGTIVANRIAVFNDTTGKVIKDSGFTIGTSVPANAKFTDTVYTHPTTSGNKHIPSGGSAGQVLKWSADGTAVWSSDTSQHNHDNTYLKLTGGTVSGTINATNLQVGGANVYTTSRKPTPADIGAAAASHGKHMPDTCTTITDWNAATSTGWVMGSGAANAPVASQWFFGEVIAHNTNYVIQTVYQFTASTDAKAIPKYIRAKMNGTWGAWTNVTVSKAVPSNAVFTDTNTWRSVQDNLTSTATDQSLSANQGKVLKALIDGKAASSHSHNSLASKGTNTINSTANDTTATWGSQGHSIHFYNTSGYLNGQPSQYGYLLNLGSGSEVHQLWMTQASGDMAHRGGNGGGWSGSWRTLLDSSNFKNYAAAASHTHSYLPLSGGTINDMLKITTGGIGFVLGDSSQEFYIKKHSSGFDMSSTGGISPHYSTNFAIYKGAPGNGQLAFQIDANKNTNVIGNLYTNRLAGYSNNDRVSIGSGNCRVDTGGNYFRVFTSPVGAGDYGLRVNPAGGISIMVNNVGKHAFNADGSKNGGSIEIEGMNYGMSPIDSPKFLIEDVLFDVDVEENGTIVELNNIFVKSINGKYGVFVNNGQVKISDKNFDNFKVSGYTGKVDIRVVGVRIGYENDYYKILGGFEHGIEEEVIN